MTHSWYEYGAGNDKSLHPSVGETNPKYTGPEPPYDRLDTNAKYSWLKSPRYDDHPMEVGPLARMLVAYGRGQPRVKALVGGRARRSSESGRRRSSRRSGASRRAPSRRSCSSRRWGAGSTRSPTTWDADDLRIHDNAKWDPSTWPKDCTGAGFHEAPRGALGHWVHIKDGAIANYQCIVPSTWNAGPRDAGGARGPYEAAAPGHAGRGPGAAPRDPADAALLRPVHGVRVHVVDATGHEVLHVRVA